MGKYVTTVLSSWDLGLKKPNSLLLRPDKNADAINSLLYLRPCPWAFVPKFQQTMPSFELRNRWGWRQLVWQLSFCRFPRKMVNSITNPYQWIIDHFLGYSGHEIWPWPTSSLRFSPSVYEIYLTYRINKYHRLLRTEWGGFRLYWKHTNHLNIGYSK